MVDVLATRMQEVWESRGVYKPSAPRMRPRDLQQKLSDRGLFNIKETEWTPLPERQQRPFMGLSCASCTPSSRVSSLFLSLNN